MRNIETINVFDIKKVKRLTFTEPWNKKMGRNMYVDSKGSGEHAQTSSLVRTFAERTCKVQSHMKPKTER